MYHKTFLSELTDNEQHALLYHKEAPIGGTRCNANRITTYYITSRGRVVRQCKKHHRWMTLTTSSNCAYHNQVRLPHTTMVVHREVGRHFMPDFNDKLFVCHKDETLPLPDRHGVDNLFMGTPSDNLKDAYEKGRKTPSNQFFSADELAERHAAGIYRPWEVPKHIINT